MIEVDIPELRLTPAETSDPALPDGHEDGSHLVAHPHLHPQSLPRREDTSPARELANLWDSIKQAVTYQIQEINCSMLDMFVSFLTKSAN